MSHTEPLWLFWITYLKRGTVHHKAFRKFLRADLASAGKTLSDIEMNEEKLHVLFVQCCKKAALMWCEYIEERHGDYAHYMKLAEEELAQGGLTFADIGKDLESLEKFKRVSTK